MQLTYEQELWKIAFDKGLLALVVVIAGFLLNRSLEKLKSSLSWGAEVLKAKMNEAKAVMTELTELTDAHLQFASTVIAFGTVPSDYAERFEKAVKALEHRQTQIRLVFEDETLKAISDVHSAALDTFQRLAGYKSPPLEPSTRQSPLPDLTPERQKKLQSESNALRSQVSRAVSALQAELKLRRFRKKVRPASLGELP